MSGLPGGRKLADSSIRRSVMKRSETHHFLRDVAVTGVASCVLFAVGLAVESGIAAAVGLVGVIFVAMLVPFIVIYFDEEATAGGHRH
jgi:hypothetical protein